MPWLLVSGCDDSELAMWDIRSNELISSIHEESISVSAIATHPKRPFAYVTSHLDNSVIFWDILDLSDIAIVMTKFFLELPLTDIICDFHDQMTPSTYGKVSGEVSRSLQLQNKKGSQLEKFEKMLKFFFHQDGNQEFLNMISICAGLGPQNSQ